MDDLLTHIAYFIDYFISLSVQKMEEVALWLIMAYSGLHTKVSNHIKILASKYPAVEYVCTSYNTISTQIGCKITKYFANYMFEPEYSPWINLTWMNYNNNIIEEYFDFSKDNNNSIEYMTINYESMLEFSSKEKITNLNGIVIMKHDNKFRCNIIDADEAKNATEGETKNDYSPSTVKFITIEYKHPDMIDGICIHLDRGWFLSGNQLLSNVFIRRYLDYQPTPFSFDERYTITLIDDDMNVSKLYNNQYVLIEKNSYSILDEVSDTDSISEYSFDSADDNE